MKKYFLSDFYVVNRMIIEAITPEKAEKLFWDKFGYFPDVVKELDGLGGVSKIIKE